MTIKNALYKLLLDGPALTEKISAVAGEQLPPLYEGDAGHRYMQAVIHAFVHNLPEDETDIYAHVKNRDDQQWGVDIDTVVPYNQADRALHVGLFRWPYKLTADTEVTAEQILIHQLRRYTSALVTVLCEEAVVAHEEGPEAQYVALINVPGYLPMAEEPAEFPTIASAWEYLAGEREQAEIAAEAIRYESDVDVVAQLRALAEASDPQVGSVYASTPDYQGDHDLGLVYTVTHKQD